MNISFIIFLAYENLPILLYIIKNPPSWEPKTSAQKYLIKYSNWKYLNKIITASRIVKIYNKLNP